MRHIAQTDFAASAAVASNKAAGEAGRGGPPLIPPRSATPSIPVAHSAGTAGRAISDGSPSVARPAPVSWRDHFAQRAKEARARMLVRQSPRPLPPPPAPPVPRAPWEEPKPCSVAVRVYDLYPGPHRPASARQVYLYRIGPTLAGAARRLLDITASKHDVSAFDITGTSRKHYIVHARQEYAWELRDKLKMTFPEIGRRMGNKDHTSALHAVRRHQARIDRGEALQ